MVDITVTVVVEVGSSLAVESEVVVALVIAVVSSNFSVSAGKVDVWTMVDITVIVVVEVGSGSASVVGLEVVVGTCSSAPKVDVCTTVDITVTVVVGVALSSAVGIGVASVGKVDVWTIVETSVTVVIELGSSATGLEVAYVAVAVGSG